jgi:hypothetical protein
VNYIRRIAGVVALLAIGAAAWLSIQLARADAESRKGTAAGVARAAEIAPLDTAYLSMEALQVEYAGGDADALLERIARITPDAAAPRIRLGLAAEARGDTASAERWLLDAARVDHQFEPRWTLANFYFRQQKTDSFWTWIHAALEVSYGSRDAAFDLCWKAAPDASVILARAIPERHDALAAFVAYQVWKQRGDAAPAAIRLSRWRDADDLPVLDTELDRLLAVGQTEAAREIWRNLGNPAPPEAGNLIIHSDFETPGLGHGFDWRLMENPGVKFTFLDTPPALRVSFSGMQPESCTVLAQFVGVRKAKRYLLRWESRGLSSGIAWHAGAVNALLRSGEDWTAGQLAFAATRDSEPIQLEYARPLGEPRLEGALELRHVSVKEQPVEEQR